MGIYLEKRIAYRPLENALPGEIRFVKDVIINKLNTLQIYGYRFTDTEKPEHTNTYYRINMEMLNPEIRRQIFEENGKVYRRSRTNPRPSITRKPRLLILS